MSAEEFDTSYPVISFEITDTPNAPPGKTAVWDANFKGVWHLPNGTSLNANDSTSNGVNGTVTSTAAATGQIDGGGSFDGSTSKIDMGNASALDSTTALTISVWIKPNSSSHPHRD